MTIHDYINISDQYGIFLVCVSGLLAIATPLYEPLNFMQAARNAYMRKFHRNGFYLGPTMCTFVILVYFWNIVLPAFDIAIHNACAMIGAVYVYILMLYSIVDEKSTMCMSAYLTLNMVTVLALYNKDPTTEEYITNVVLFSVFVYLSNIIYLSVAPWEQNLQWHIWYSGTLGGVLRW